MSEIDWRPGDMCIAVRRIEFLNGQYIEMGALGCVQSPRVLLTSQHVAVAVKFESLNNWWFVLARDLRKPNVPS